MGARSERICETFQPRAPGELPQTFFSFAKQSSMKSAAQMRRWEISPASTTTTWIWTPAGASRHHRAGAADSLYMIRDHAGDRLTLKSREESVAGLRRILRKHGLS